MKAMIFAAGRGTRLRPFTDRHPKALARVGGLTLLELVAERLRQAGVREVVINLHHLGPQIEEFVRERDGLGLRFTFSREEQLLDTGGGLKHAAWFFKDAGPFLVHNVDVLSDVDLRGVVRAHEGSGALATLVAQERPTSRPLLFDGEGRLCGREAAAGRVLVRAPQGRAEALGFCGIHVISPALLGQLTESGAFSLVDAYLRLAGAGADIRLHRAEGARWRDAGRPEDLRPL